ncbi:hypothetical protein HanXRQr2_Chr15g0715201 [Helianthus annuus]|uniref:Uncharacterized protein n=1 Tax=Helianthus annuus TaxID=4232 RepID=A0A9K3H3V1_HELAN|nr:hypothetical protein HanXRQr2_Chr15g0715201 [Helianthus annuus]KAJ0457820.1 hypothetical protein HanIR_Chr15g0778111 [Helianthus annuus]KAJ0833089.1 hypothetical protein HanPSC8_Chr15g0686281 [Helianthus annuus]
MQIHTHGPSPTQLTQNPKISHLPHTAPPHSRPEAPATGEWSLAPVTCPASQPRTPYSQVSSQPTHSSLLYTSTPTLMASFNPPFCTCEHTHTSRRCWKEVIGEGVRERGRNSERNSCLRRPCFPATE